MKQRLFTAIIMLVLFVPPFIVGGLLLLGLIAAWSLIASFELLGAMGKEKNNFVVTLFVLMLEFLLFLTIALNNFAYIPLVLLLIFLTFGVFYLYSSAFKVCMLGTWTLAVMIPALGFGSLALIASSSLRAIAFIFVITISTDMFAYIIGVPFGRHKLAPSLSPKKSIEGSIGGLVAATLFVTLYVALAGSITILNMTISVGLAPLLGFLISVIGQAGDLFASKIKREASIKDYSSLLPGHGGIMDRFDSAIWASMFMVVFVMVVDLL
jgi:phosphatidate cytidylyltransferase